MAYIEIKGLRKSYIERRGRSRSLFDPYVPPGNQNLVLDDINLAFEAGEMVCILGPSGCGKSTMLRIAAGFDRATAGEVVINGVPVKRPRSDVIFVFQHSALLPWLTVWENVQMGLRRMTDAEERDGIVREYLEMVELEGFEENYPYQLSGGMKRRAELARALAVDPEALFMDEPFTGLDFFVHMKLREEIVNLHQFFEKTIVMVTHDIDDALVMGDRIVVLSGRPSQVKMERVLDFPRPRDFRRDAALNDLRSEIFLMLGVPYAV